jgi:hypothetical protein
MFGLQIVNWRLSDWNDAPHSEPFNSFFFFELQFEPLHTELTGDYHPIQPYWNGSLHFISEKKIKKFGKIFNELLFQITGNHFIGNYAPHHEEGEPSISIAIFKYWETDPYTVLFPV